MFFYKEKILNPQQLKKLQNHTYSCTNNSLIDPLLQPFWNWLVSIVPLWLAPNLLTIFGLGVNVFTTLVLLSFCTDAKSPCPSWAYFLCAAGLFIYQSLDSIDGKQARRTNTSSPLGELFDHGCDSISTVFVAISTCASVQLGHYPTLMFFECFCVFALFYCAHWQTFVSGTLHFGKIDVTEAQVAIMCIHSLSGYFGPEIWRMRTMGFEPWYLIVGMTLLTGVLVVTDFITTIRKGGCGKNGSTIAGTSIISPILPFILVMFPAYVISRMSQSGIYENHPILYIMTFGLLISKVTNRLVVAHMTKSEMNWFDKGLIGPLMMILNQYFNEFIPEYLVLWLALLWIIFDLCMYCMLVCLEICKHLKIKLFKIPFNKRKQSITRASSDLNHNKKH